MAFTDFGIDNLIELVKMHRENPKTVQALTSERTPCGLRRMVTSIRA
jgi:hypothetical protein